MVREDEEMVYRIPSFVFFFPSYGSLQPYLMDSIRWQIVELAISVVVN